jgi:hypothetical protein
MELTNLQKKLFFQNGFLVLKSCTEINPLIEEIRKEICELGCQFIKNFSIDGSVEKIELLTSNNRKAFYSGLRYLPSTTRLACSRLLIGISNQLKILQPAVMHSYNLRMDMPNEPQFMFHWHQDITYLLGSKNSITYWVPLTSVNAHNGSIELIARSHKEGLFPYLYTGEGRPPPQKSMSPKDIKLVKEPIARSKLIEAEPGDIVVFSQFLLHRSTPNSSELTRWAAQVRHSDLAEADFQKAGFPFGDVTNIFHNDYLN